MSQSAAALLTLGGVLFVGLVADEFGRRTGVPRVTVLLVLGFGMGPGGFDILPDTTEDWFPIVATIALTMVGFLLGAEFEGGRIRGHGSGDVVLSLTQALVTAAVVGGGLLVAGADPVVALALAGIAVATAPAATVAMIKDRGAAGPFTSRLLVVTALDDVIALTLFGVLITAASLVKGDGGGAGLLAESLWEVFGAVGLGLVLGLPLSVLTGRLRPGEPTQEEAYAAVLVCGGLALWLDVSFLLAAVVLGATVANLARHHEVPFREIERIEWPALVVFFVFAGALLELDTLGEIGAFGVLYISLRVVGKLVGCALGGRYVGMSSPDGWWLGAAMLPQAGVALGLTLLAADRFPEVADEIVPIVIVATVVFELIGPVVTGAALTRVGETGASTDPGDS